MKNEDNSIETLLNQIYKSPDLGDKVLEFIHPHILKAFALIEDDDYRKKEGLPRIFTQEEDITALKTILFKDLPSIFNIYTKLPLEYRNEQKIKTGKTHREVLLSNMVSLVNKMIAIENLQYEEVDKEAIVKTKVFDAKYSKYGKEENIDSLISQENLKPQNEVMFENTFDLENFKKTLPPTEFKMEGYQHTEDNNIQIKFKKGVVEYKVKDKMKSFMKGVYDFGCRFMKDEKFAVKTKNVLKTTGLIITAPITIPLGVIAMPFLVASEEGFGGFVGVLIFYGVIYGVGNVGYGFVSDAVNDKAINNIEYVTKYNYSPTLELQKMNMVVLNEYVKKHPNISLKEITQNNAEFLSLDIKADKGVCNYTLENMPLKNLIKEDLDNYKVNNIELSLGSSIQKDMRKALCAKDENIIHLDIKKINVYKESPENKDKKVESSKPKM